MSDNRLMDAIDAFRAVLRAGAIPAVRIAEAGGLVGYVDTWMQGCWETLVEAAIDIDGTLRLGVYGDGADCQQGSRVFDPTAEPTHEVRCRWVARSLRDALSGAIIEIPSAGAVVDRFVTIVGGWHSAAPPFDHVLCAVDGREVVFPLDGAEMFVARLGRD